MTAPPPIRPVTTDSGLYRTALTDPGVMQRSAACKTIGISVGHHLRDAISSTIAQACADAAAAGEPVTPGQWREFRMELMHALDASVSGLQRELMVAADIHSRVLHGRPLFPPGPSDVAP